ncbi:MAG: helix-turn-helix domain-containing protein, partial [Candidatus Micrarchaeota archaeon]
MLERLKELGLTDYELRVYEALLKSGSATGGEISKKSGVPHGKTYMSLQALESKGLITILPTKPKVFKLIEPSKGIKIFSGKKIQEIEDLSELLISSARQFEPEEESVVKEDLIILNNRKEIFDYGAEQFANAKKEVFLISKGEKTTTKIYREMEKFKKRGVDFKFIVFKFDEENKDILRQYYSGVELRHYPVGQFTLFVTDGKEADIIVRNPKNLSDELGIVFQNRAIAKQMRDYFLMIW